MECDPSLCEKQKMEYPKNAKRLGPRLNSQVTSVHHCSSNIEKNNLAVVLFYIPDEFVINETSRKEDFTLLK
jgi:hypothetical protein